MTPYEKRLSNVEDYLVSAALRPEARVFAACLLAIAEAIRETAPCHGESCEDCKPRNTTLSDPWTES